MIPRDFIVEPLGAQTTLKFYASWATGSTKRLFGRLLRHGNRVLAEPGGANDLTLTREALAENLAAIQPLAAAA